jgi:hypothetical protein
MQRWASYLITLPLSILKIHPGHNSARAAIADGDFKTRYTYHQKSAEASERYRDRCAARLIIFSH